jgi:hypothetical protein
MPFNFPNRLYQFVNSIEHKYNFNIKILMILCLVAQQSLLVKIPGLILLVLISAPSIYKIQIKKIPLFYTIIPTLEVLKFFFLDPEFSKGHLALFLVGITYWIFSVMVSFIIFETVNKNELLPVENSLKIFVLINLIFSLFQIGKIALHEGVINPYNTGHEHPYGISSGDWVNGILGGVHIINAFISVMLVLYFMYRRNVGFSVLALIPILLCGSNYATICLILCIALFFTLQKLNSKYFSNGLLLSILILLFYGFVAPMNATYAITKISSVLGIKPVSNEQRLIIQSIESPIARKDSIIPIQDSKMKTYDFSKESGKTTAYSQTRNFLRNKPEHLLFGAGMGRFSSRLAFDFSGSTKHMIYSKFLPKYSSPTFDENHRSIFDFLNTTHVIFHSESNKPSSTYNQLLGEYGLIGFVCFIIFYLLYFLKRISYKSYALPLIALLLFAFNLDYYIESINILLFFELLMYLDIKNKQTNWEIS